MFISNKIGGYFSFPIVLAAIVTGFAVAAYQIGLKPSLNISVLKNGVIIENNHFEVCLNKQGCW